MGNGKTQRERGKRKEKRERERGKRKEKRERERKRNTPRLATPQQAKRRNASTFHTTAHDTDNTRTYTNTDASSDSINNGKTQRERGKRKEKRERERGKRKEKRERERKRNTPRLATPQQAKRRNANTFHTT